MKQELFTDVIIALGSRTLKESKVRSIGSKNIVDSLNEHDLSPTLHVISAHGVGDSWGSLKWYEKIVSNLFLKNTMKEHNLQERTITANSNNYHIIRPVALNNDPATKKIVANKDGILPNGSISRADVAYFIIENMFANTRGASSICKE